MGLWARLQESLVAELTATDPAGRFHASLRWLPVPEHLADWVEPGWRQDQRTLVPPSLDALERQIAGRVADRRWRAETATLTVQAPAGQGQAGPTSTGQGQAGQALTIRIDGKTEARIGRAARLVAGGRTRPLPWKLADGRFADLAAPQILALDAAVSAHLEACFARETAIMAAVRAADSVAGKIAACTAALDTGWPAPGQPAPGQPDPGQPDPGQPAPGRPAPGRPAPGRPDSTADAP